MISGVVSKAKKTLTSKKSSGETESNSQTVSNGVAKKTSKTLSPVESDKSSSVYDFDTIEDGSEKMSYSAYRSHSVSPEKQAAKSEPASTCTDKVSQAKKSRVQVKKKVVSKKSGVKDTVISTGKKKIESKQKDDPVCNSTIEVLVPPPEQQTANVRGYQH